MAEPMLGTFEPGRIVKFEAVDRSPAGLPAGLPEPLVGGRACGDGSLVAFRTARGSILAMALDDAGAAALAQVEAALNDGGPWVAFDVGDGYAALELSGDRVLDILAAGTALDLSDQTLAPSPTLPPEGGATEGFPVGAAQMTGLAHVPALLWRSAGETVRILVARSYGDWMMAWLRDAGRAYGISMRED
ncbi:hypothetical protein [Inquilinus sp. CAU 1745]|uniref:hypothetical protein n=1 Tax=Inquilinus sp. CAU 1745 TaxID=3140369 RepID=UPI00325C04FD